MSDDIDGGPMHLMMADDFAEMEDVIQKLSLCVDDYGVAQSTHYIRDGKIEPKGSFIELVERAKKITEKLLGDRREEAGLPREEPKYPVNRCPVCDAPMLGNHYHESEESDDE